MDIKCPECGNEMDDNNDVFECDGCASHFHLKCGGTNKTEVKARKNSKCLRMYCSHCVNNPANCVAENVKMVMKMVFKLDLFNQKQVENQVKMEDSITHSSERLADIKGQIDLLHKKSEENNNNGTAKRQIYANVVKSSAPAIKPAVIVRPKDTQQKCEKTYDDITGNIDDKEVNVCNIRHVRNGGVLLSCNNTNDTMKVKQLVESKFGENYDVQLPTIKKPRVLITNICDKINEEDIIKELKGKNEALKDMNLELKKVIKRKIRADTFFDVVIEVDIETFKKLLQIGTVYLAWRECKIEEHVHIKRCFKCNGFSHISSECRRKQCCPRCAGEHKFDECESNSLCCVNCKVFNNKNNASLQTNHHALNKNCAVLLNRINKLKTKIQYDDIE